MIRPGFATCFALLARTMFLLDTTPPNWNLATLSLLVSLETALGLLRLDPYLSPPAKAGGLSPAARAVAKAESMVRGAWESVDAGAPPEQAWKILAKIRATLAKAEAAAPQE